MDKQNKELVKAHGLKSQVWNHYGFEKKNGIVDKTVAVCRYCYEGLKYSGSTSSLMNHIRRHHKSEAKLDSKGPESSPSPSACSGPSPPPVASLFAVTQKFSDKSPKAKAITESISMFIVKDMRPYTIVESKAFKTMINTCEPRYKVPSRVYFSETAIPKLYNEQKLKIFNDLSQAIRVATTTDGWTSRATVSYITITSHHITPDWELKNYVLQTRAIYESHTGVNVGTILREAAQEWGYSDKNPSCTVDNAANMDVAANEAGIELTVKCMAHTLNLASQKAFKLGTVARVLGRIRRIVGFFNRSTTAAHVFREFQKKQGLPNHKLIQDVVTRWNSSYNMLQRFLEQQPAVYSALTAKELRKASEVSTPSDDDIRVSQDVVELMQVLKTCTTMMCEESQPTASIIAPLKAQIISAFELAPGDSTIIKEMKKTVVNDLKSRYTPVLQQLHMITSLDPRFKALQFLGSDERTATYSDVMKEATKLWEEKQRKTQASIQVKIEADEIQQNPENPEAEPPLPALLPEMAVQPEASVPKKVKREPCDLINDKLDVKPKSVMSQLFGDVEITHVEEAKDAIVLAENEVQAYRVSDPVPIDMPPLVWWKANEYKFPLLAYMAKYYLCVPGTSVPSERVFSTAGDIVTAQRSNLHPDNVDMLIFLKKNLQV